MRKETAFFMEITIQGDITPKTLTQLADDLKPLQDGEELVVKIDTLGGWLEVALDICNVLKKVKERGCAVTTENIGDVMSAGTFIYLMGDRRIWNEDAGDFLIHKTAATVYGNSDEINKEAQTLNELDKQIAEIYAIASGIDTDIIEAVMELSQPMTADAVFAFGFCTELVVNY